jgi:hypothetical protein
MRDAAAQTIAHRPACKSFAFRKLEKRSPKHQEAIREDWARKL